MFRFIRGLVAVVSAVLCIGVIVLGVRSLHHTDIFATQTPSDHIMGVATDHGALLMAYSDTNFTGFTDTDGADRPFGFFSFPPEKFSDIHDTLLDTTAVKTSFIGFKTATGTFTSLGTANHFSALRLPCWCPAILLAIPPILVLRGAWTRRKRRRRGLCLVCGYDMRASHGRCPECGTEKVTT